MLMMISCDITEKYAEDHDFNETPPALDGLAFKLECIYKMSDPIRPEAPAMILALREAHVKVIMLTGDHPGTAKRIAQEANIIIGTAPTADEIARQRGIVIKDVDPIMAKSVVFTNDEITKLSKYDLAGILLVFPEIVVSRCSPETKILLCKVGRRARLIRNRGSCRLMTIGMSGDGMNDAPAMKEAQLGLSFPKADGIAKEAADVILDETSMLSFVYYGRILKDRVIATIAYGMRNIMAAMFPVVLAFYADSIALMMPTMLIFIDLLVNLVPMVAAANEPISRDLMRETREFNKNFHPNQPGNFCNNFLLYFLMSMVVSYFAFGTVLQTFGFHHQDTFDQESFWRAKDLVMGVTNSDLFLSHSERIAINRVGMANYAVVIIYMQMLHFVLTKTRVVSLTRHPLAQNTLGLVVEAAMLAGALGLVAFEFALFDYGAMNGHVACLIWHTMVALAGFCIFAFDELRKLFLRRIRAHRYKHAQRVVAP